MVKKINPGSQPPPPTVATLLIAYNNVADVERCLASLSQIDQSSFRHLVVLVDNSTDAAARRGIATIAHHYPDLVLFKPQVANIGFASGVNKALYAADKAGADYYFILNIDTEVTPNIITKLLATQRQTGAAIVTPLIVFGDTPNIIYYAGGRVRPWLGIVQHPHRHRPVTAADRQPRAVTFANGCAMFVPKSTITTYGNLFAAYFMYYEETDLCARILKGKGTLYYEPAALVRHYTPQTDDKSANAIYFLTRNHWLYVRRNLAWWYKLTAYPTVAGFQLYRLIKYAFKREHRRAILQGVRDAILNRYGPRVQR